MMAEVSSQAVVQCPAVVAIVQSAVEPQAVVWQVLGLTVIALRAFE